MLSNLNEGRVAWRVAQHVGPEEYGKHKHCDTTRYGQGKSTKNGQATQYEAEPKAEAAGSPSWTLLIASAGIVDTLIFSKVDRWRGTR